MSDSGLTKSGRFPSNPSMGVVVHRSAETPPKGAFLLSPSELAMVQWNRVKNWRPQEDVWPLRHGLKLLTVSTLMCGYVTALHTRRHFQLTTQRFITTMFPTTLLPGMMGMLAYHTYIHTRVLAGKAECSVCVETQGALTQVSAGAALPFLMSLTVCMAVAKLERTYPVPAPSDWRGVLKVAQLTARSSRVPLCIIFGLQTVLGGWMAGKMFNTNLYMRHHDSLLMEEADQMGWIPEQKEPDYRIHR